MQCLQLRPGDAHSQIRPTGPRVATGRAGRTGPVVMGGRAARRRRLGSARRAGVRAGQSDAELDLVLVDPAL